MGHLLNKSATILCPHGGQVTITTSNSHSKGGGDYLVCKTDTFTIAGCAFTLPTNSPHPCMTVEWSAESGHSKSSGAAHLTESSVGMCKAGDGAVQGTVQIANTQTKVQGT